MISIVLAAGKGTRMKSNNSKLVHKVNGKALIVKVLDVLKEAKIERNILVLGYLKEQILSLLPSAEYVIQEPQLGTAHSIMVAKEIIKNLNEDILICYGDGPLLTSKTILNMKDKFYKENLDALILSCNVDNPKGYGRIIKFEDKVVDIIEEIDADEKQKLIKEINTGVYIFKREALLDIIDKFTNDNMKKEYYLTDSVKLLNSRGYKVESILLEDNNEMLGVNSKAELARASSVLRKRKNEDLMNFGVILIDPLNTYIEEDVFIGKDSVIYPNVYITKNTKIGENCIIYSNTRIENSIIGDNVIIDSSIVEYSEIRSDVKIGPFAHLRPESILKKGVKVGNFVEIKKSILNENVKCGHLTYIGDSEIGFNTNIGAGTITCNYDGENKHKTIIGENSFIGSNSIIIAPLTIGKNVLTAAGSVITKNVPDDSLAFGRAKQVIKEGIYKKKG